MEKKVPVQKKKTTIHFVLETLIKILTVIVVIIFGFLAYHKISISSGFDFSSASKNKKDTRMPSELKWFDDFKGIENVPDKNAKGKTNSGEPQNFLQYESQKNKK
ncbi:hypothetical protein [Halarcobacter anaerophilus]|uniref:Uncharacterized protein n=1 Tax=Halarcobacter anaerophilus TaxID=877500 RepID=A0A4Q0Y1D0_9BACT|nr:hypothetical protein [Halarcobacter anaerophilus]QDF28312.1 hypothetical protein AANAER_0820 [Halarcobacter anaerophilus]RXJ62021.1 hypothetical protein CRV06_11340 [Halarcobacter anaerophilus]